MSEQSLELEKERLRDKNNVDKSLSPIEIRAYVIFLAKEGEAEMRESEKTIV